MRKQTNKMNNRPVLSKAEWIVNFPGSCALDTLSFLLIHSYTHQPRNKIPARRDFFMQNEPNFESTASLPTSPHEPRATGHESRLIQNEPNLTAQNVEAKRMSQIRRRRTSGGQNEPNLNLNAPTKQANAENFTPIFSKKIRNITKYCKITQNFTHKKCIFPITFQLFSLLFLLLLRAFLHFLSFFPTFGH